MRNSKSINSVLNALTAVLLTVVNGILSIVVTKFVILYFGSDFNGLNSTVNQLVSILLIMEGGFSLATNYALFEPIHLGDTDKIDGILSATRIQFKKVASYFLLLGIVVAVIYAHLINSALSKNLIFSVIFMAVFPQAINLYFATTYRVYLQAIQKEYIINCISLLTITAGHITNILLIILGGKMWMVRAVTMTYSILNSILIITYVKKITNIDLNVSPKGELIKGTKDVLYQKITAVIYNTFPIVFLSVSPTGGTMLASVYAVYNSVFTMLKSVAHGFVDAPRLSIGQLISEKSNADVWRVFKQYEFIAFIISFVFLSTAQSLILPFISIYTRDVTDINYYDMTISTLLVISTAFEIIHIPSGHLINMSGNFNVSKTIQIISCAILVISMTFAGNLWGIHGMLLSVMCTSIVLSILEMGYVHVKYFNHKEKEFAALFFPYVLAMIAVWLYTDSHDYFCKNYLELVLYACVTFVSRVIIALGVSIVFNRDELIGIFKRILAIIKRCK